MIGNGDGDAIYQHFESLIEHNFTSLKAEILLINTIKVLIKVLKTLKKNKNRIRKKVQEKIEVSSIIEIIPDINIVQTLKYLQLDEFLHKIWEIKCNKGPIREGISYNISDGADGIH